MGDHVIRWTRGKPIGKGTYGTVSLAKTLNLFSVDTIAVKSALFSRSKSLEKETKLLHEFQDCPNIIRCFGADATVEGGNIVYNMLLEYASGGSMAAYIRRKGLSEFEVKKYAKSVLSGLSCIHSRGFVHGDIKPENILIVGMDKIAKIADFGFAEKVEQTAKRKRGGGLKGTPMYMAPELVLDNAYGPEVDVWAFGCTVFYMITGKLIWDLKGIKDVVYLLCKIGLESPDLENEKLSKEARDFLEKCLDRNPSLRWTADMLLNHSFLSSDDDFVQETGKHELMDFLSLTDIGFEADPFIDDFCDSRELKPMKLLNCRPNKRRRMLCDSRELKPMKLLNCRPNKTRRMLLEAC